MKALRIVLVEPSHPGNIGAVARIMKNMGFTCLVLVRPRRFPDDEAYVRSSGAEDILNQARVVNSLDAALQGCRCAYGLTARLRELSESMLTPENCAESAVAMMSEGDAALVFGRESAGLTNDELDRCRYLVGIPSQPDFSSLNLAMAVTVMIYELAKVLPDRKRLQQRFARSSRELPVQTEEMEMFYNHLQRVLEKIDFLNPDNPRYLMRRLRQFFNRAEPGQREMNILRGILTQVEKHTDR